MCQVSSLHTARVLPAYGVTLSSYRVQYALFSKLSSLCMLFNIGQVGYSGLI